MPNKISLKNRSSSSAAVVLLVLIGGVVFFLSIRSNSGRAIVAQAHHLGDGQPAGDERCDPVVRRPGLGNAVADQIYADRPCGSIRTSCLRRLPPAPARIFLRSPTATSRSGKALPRRSPPRLRRRSTRSHCRMIFRMSFRRILSWRWLPGAEISMRCRFRSTRSR